MPITFSYCYFIWDLVLCAGVLYRCLTDIIEQVRFFVDGTDHIIFPILSSSLLIHSSYFVLPTDCESTDESINSIERGHPPLRDFLSLQTR